MSDRDVRAELHRLELALAARDPHGVEGGLASLIPDDFLEFGASGRTWDAAATRALLGGAPPVEGLVLEDFAVAELAPDVMLATYRLGGSRPSNRASVWVSRGGRWVMRFHQGTLRDT